MMEVNDKLYVSIDSLHPTQFCLGFKEVDHKVKLLQKMTKAEYDLYLIEKITPVVIGPNSKLYLIDHHHHATSLIRFKKEEIYVEILEDWSNTSVAEFVNKMADKKYLNLLDSHNNKKTFAELPEKLTDMNHDYFRSLAWAVREKSGFKKVDEIPFFEFRWGEYFRKYINEALVAEEFDLAVELALKLCKRQEAKGLPGYIEK